MIFPFFNNRKDGEEYSSPSILDIFRWMMFHVKNEKYFVPSTDDLISIITENGNLSSRSIIVHKMLFKAIRRSNTIIKDGKINFSKYFKYAGYIEYSGKKYKIYFTKKVIKRNMAFSISDDSPFSIWKDTQYHISKKTFKEGQVKKCQIKIWP